MSKPLAAQPAGCPRPVMYLEVDSTRHHTASAYRYVWKWPAIVFVAGLVLTGTLAWFAWSRSHLRDRGRVENAIQRTSAAIEAEVAVYIGLLRATAGLFAAVETVTADKFHVFAERIDLPKRYPGVQGIGFAQRARAEELPALLRTFQPSGQGPLIVSPPGDREEYYPIVYLEPMDRRNQQAIGYDMFSDPVRRAAMMRARDEGVPTTSGRVILVQEIDPEKQSGFLIYLPVYRGGGPPETVADRRAAIIGFVYSPFRAGDLLSSIVGNETMPRLHFEVFDGPDPAPANSLYRSPIEVAERPLFVEARRLQIADRTWTVLYRTAPAFEAGSSRSWAFWVSAGGVLISGMLGAITWALARAAAQSRERGRELFDQREQLRVTLSSIGDAVISTDAQGRVVFMNRIAERLTGWRMADARHRPLREVFAIANEATGEPAADPVDIVLREGAVVGLANHTVLRSRDGAVIPIDDSAAPICAEDGKVIGVVLVFHDVTEKRRNQESLRRSETRKDAILRSALDAIITIDHESRVVEFNPAAERIFGYARADIIGHSLADYIIPARFREQHYRGLAHYLATGEGPVLRRQIELPAVRADGTEFPAELAIMPIAGVQPPMFTAFLRDISERKQAEQQLREASERFRFMAESMPQKIFTARPDGEFEYLNQQWAQFTGFDLAELARAGWARFVHPDDLGENLRRWQEALATGEPMQLEHRIRRRDGVYRWHLTRAHALHDEHGAIRLWIGSNTDIDDQKRAEERLERSVAERTAALRETNEQLEAFVYTIAHDLRGPLRAITGYSQLLAEDYQSAFDEAGRHLLQRVRGSAEFMDRLILDLLAFGRVARAEIELAPVEVQHAWTTALTQTAAHIEQMHADIETIGPLPVVRAHEATLGQVLANLLSNALKFVASGVRPRVVFRSETRGDHVRLWLEDNGIGIAPELHDRVFRVFERLHGTRYPGTGIGLSIVRKGIERMGGKVGLESHPGQGSRFWIELQKAG